MSPLTLRSAIVASILAGDVQWFAGRLLADRTRAGEIVPLDPESAGELKADDRPAFILSTEGAATDAHIVRQFWDVTRGAPTGPGTPVLWNHNPDVLLGQWEEHGVQRLSEVGPCLIARARLDPDDEVARTRRRQISTGILRGVSVGWIPGARVRRGSLAETDPLFEPQEDDDCGQPMEGFVMGTEGEPNILVEASLTPIPSDPRAVKMGRFAHATRQLGSLTRGERVSGVDLGAVLLALRDQPAVRSWARRMVAEELRSVEGRALLREFVGAPGMPGTPEASISDLFKGG